MKDKATQASTETIITPDEPQLETATLLGDVRDALLAEFKAIDRPWEKMTEDQQDRLIHRAQDVADSLVRRTVNIVAEQGFANLAVTINKFTVKDGVKIEVGAAETVENITQLAMHGGAAVLVLASMSAFDREKAPAEADNVGDLAIPKTGPGAPSDPAAVAALGRGKNGTAGTHANA